MSDFRDASTAFPSLGAHGRTHRIIMKITIIHHRTGRYRRRRDLRADYVDFRLTSVTRSGFVNGVRNHDRRSRESRKFPTSPQVIRTAAATDKKRMVARRARFSVPFATRRRTLWKRAQFRLAWARLRRPRWTDVLACSERRGWHSSAARASFTLPRDRRNRRIRLRRLSARRASDGSGDGSAPSPQPPGSSVSFAATELSYVSPVLPRRRRSPPRATFETTIFLLRRETTKL